MPAVMLGLCWSRGSCDQPLGPMCFTARTFSCLLSCWKQLKECTAKLKKMPLFPCLFLRRVEWEFEENWKRRLLQILYCMKTEGPALSKGKNWERFDRAMLVSRGISTWLSLFAWLKAVSVFRSLFCLRSSPLYQVPSSKNLHCSDISKSQFSLQRVSRNISCRYNAKMFEIYFQNNSCLHKNWQLILSSVNQTSSRIPIVG